MKKILLLLALFLSIGLQQTAMAQNETTVTGRVLDDQGEGIPGVSVQIKGTHSGANTDVDGNFMIKLPEGHNVLIVKSSGFATQEVKISNPGQALVIKMKPSKATLGTISVYGQKIDPRTNTGTVTTVTAEEIAKKPITNIVKALDAAPGVQLTSGGGQPGADPAIMMRGLGSLSANSSPLIVLDGVPYAGAMSSINPSDVATISMLKDATASSLYGARGANGVILITLKKGRNSDKPQINIDAQTGFVSRFLPSMDVITDPAEYYKMALLMMRDYYAHNSGLQAHQALSAAQMATFWGAVIGGRGYNNYSVNGKGVIESSYGLLNTVTGDINPDAKLLYNENWLPQLERTGLRQQYNVSTSNGNDKSNYYFSLGYNNDEGIVQYSSYQRITSRLNVDANITPWLKTGISTYGTYEDQRAFTTQSNAYINPFFTAQTMAPIYPVHVHDTLGNLVYGPDGKALYDLGTNMQYDQFRSFGANTNIVAALQADDHTNKNYTFRGVTYLEGKFLKDFTARVDYTLEYYNYNSNVYQNMLFGDGAGSKGIVNQASNAITNTTFRQRVVWNPSFGPFASGENSLAVTVAHENNLLNNQTYSLQRSGFTDPIFRQGDAAAVNKGSGSYINQLAMESYLALATYDLKKKYFLKASIRRDGTSRFSPDERWGNFWSVGAGWMMSEEDFMSSTTNWLSELKLKASYGVQGNEDLGASDYYAWLPNYYFSPNATQPGYLFNSYGSLDLHWEGSYMFDAGFDFGFLNQRISGSLDYYRKGSYDLLYQKPFAPSTGIGAIRANIGTMLNSGLELTVKADIIRTKDFTWNAQLNLTHNNNQITKMQGDSLVLYPYGYTIMKKGLAYGTFFMPKYAGVNPKNGDELWELADGTDTNDYSVASLPENKRKFGTPWPVVNGAFVNTLTYKNLSLSFQLNFGIGGKFLDLNYLQLMQPGNAYGGRTWSTDILDSWTPENTSASLPRLGIGESNIGGVSDRFLISRTYLKIQNINLSYNLPSKWLKNASFRSASVFVAADNVYMFSARKGVDVQSSFFGTNSLSYYPYRTVMFGVKLGL